MPGGAEIVPRGDSGASGTPTTHSSRWNPRWDWTCTGSTRLRLTDGGGFEAGSAFFNTLVNVQSFTNDFSFQLTNPDADGITFTIQGNSPTALGFVGGGLGYSGIGKSVAVKFDLYDNAGEGNDSTGLYTNGAITNLFVDLSNTGIDLHSEHLFNVHMTYDGATLVMQISDVTESTRPFSTLGVLRPT